MKKRHLKVKQIVLRRTYRKDNARLMEGEVWFKQLRLFTVKRTFQLRLSLRTGEVKSY